MCVATDGDLPVALQPRDDAPLDRFLYSIGDLLLDSRLPDPQPLDEPAFASRLFFLDILPPTCGRSKFEDSKRFQDMAHHEPAHGTEAVVIPEIRLVPVHRKDPLPRPGVSQDQSFANDDSILLHPVAPPILHVVIAYDEVQPPLLVKLVEQIKDPSVGLPHVAEPPVMPKLVAVSDLDVGKSLAIIVGQCVQEQVLVLGESIDLAVVSPVTVAKENDPGRVVKGNLLRRLEYLGQPLVREGARAAQSSSGSGIPQRRCS